MEEGEITDQGVSEGDGTSHWNNGDVQENSIKKD